MRHDKSTKDQSGFTLIELMIAMVLTLIMVAGAVNVLINQRKAYWVQDQTLEMQQNTRGSLNYIVEHLQTTGYDPQESDKFGITVYQVTTPFFPDSATSLSPTLAATSNAELYFTTDAMNGDGIIDNDGTERFGFRVLNNILEIASIQASDGDIATWETLSEQIESMAITYTFADNGVGLPDNGDADTTNDFEDIRVVTVALTGRTAKSDPDYSGDGYRRITLSSKVFLRNLGY